MIVLADMGNEPDEEQQIIHLMMCSNEFDIEGLIAVTGKFLRPEDPNPYRQKLHPELFHNIIDKYAAVYPNLQIHAKGWHTPDYLKSIVVSGQTGYGIENTGTGKTSEGAALIVKAVTNSDSRPLYVIVNAGSNTLAQALKDYQSTHSKKEVDDFVAKLRVYENGAQDNSGAWICANFPNIHWVRSNYQTYCFAGPAGEGAENGKGDLQNLGPNTWEPYAHTGIGQHQWVLEHVKGNHGQLGAIYPIRQFPKGAILFIEGGGTIPFLGLVHKGLNDINHPYWGGWSGLFTREKGKNMYSKHASISVDEKKGADFFVFTEAADSWTNPEDGTVYSNSIFSPIWRWRRAFFNDFKCRMDWCFQPFEKANHHPIAAINGDNREMIMSLQTKAGEKIVLDASASSDPDKDKLDYSWWIYTEAGTYNKPITLSVTNTPKIEFQIPNDAKGKEIHLILEIKDNNPIGALYDYRRVVFYVN